MDIDDAVAQMGRMTVGQLRQQYAELFGETARSGNKPWFLKRIAWRMQARAQGDLPERARRLAEQLAEDAVLRLMPPQTPKGRKTKSGRAGPARQRSSDPRLPGPDAVITRQYKGRLLQVTVRENGFEYQGELYSSLSAAANAITGSHTSGFLFFRLGKHSEEPR